MADNHYTKEEKLIEDIEEYYLSVITRYLGADPEGLVQNLENLVYLIQNLLRYLDAFQNEE